jgi:hypothetical protein
MGPDKKPKAAHQNQQAENQEYVTAVHLRNGSRLTSFAASTQGGSGPIPWGAWAQWVAKCAAQDDEPYSYGIVEPLGLPRAPDACTNGLDARPQFRVVNGASLGREELRAVPLPVDAFKSWMDRQELGLDRFDSGETVGPELWRQQRQWRRLKVREERTL